MTIATIDAAVPADSDKIREGALRIRDTRTKLNEVIAAINAAYTPTEDHIYWDVTTSPVTITVPTGYTKMHILCIAGGSGAGGNYHSGPRLDGKDGWPGTVVCGGSIDVVAGETYSLAIGAGGTVAVGNGVPGNPGTATILTKVSDSTVVAAAQGGDGGAGGTTGPNPATVVTSAPSVPAKKQRIYQNIYASIPTGGLGGTGQPTAATAGQDGYCHIRFSNQALE